MPGFNLYTSNRIEHLSVQLIQTVSLDPLPPMTQETVVIPSGGMERYISFAFADSQKICANFHFPFPNAFIHYIFQRILSKTSTRSHFNPDLLTWKIMELLPSFLSRKHFKQLNYYLHNDINNIKLYQLSTQIADLFDRYTIYRPDMMQRWEKNASNIEDELWQSELWHSITQSIDENNRITLRDLLNKAIINNSNKIQETLPKRISLFGISYLPKFHLDILTILSKITEIHLFALNPCKHFWDDIVSIKQITKKKQTDIGENSLFTSQHYETGNNLLASLGIHGKEFFNVIHSIECNEENAFFDNEQKTILEQIQSDILNLQTNTTKRIISKTDNSIQIHLCHSPLREMEILQNNLLSLFKQHPQLTPNDIVIISPDIDLYIPFIETVFNNPSQHSQYMPYSIADKTSMNHSSIIRDFFNLLDLASNRYKASSVLEVLESEFIRNKYGFTEEDLFKIKTWINETQIRWGIDEKFREKINMPDTKENTWQAGLDRLFLGSALHSKSYETFNSILPYDSIDSNDLLLLGKLSSFLESVFSHQADLEKPKPLKEWAKKLISILDQFFNNPIIRNQALDSLYTAVTDLSEQQTLTNYTAPLALSVIRSRLESTLSQKKFGQGFMTGGITFCTMLPMRSIPFKVLCLVGMNDTTFPRKSPRLSFDLIASNPRIGDRHIKNEDRYCFLESLISARQILYISYIGKNIKDNTIIPPSVIIAELCDHIASSFQTPDSSQKSIVSYISTHHRLMAFNKEYFSTSTHKELFSYSKENYVAVDALLNTNQATPEPFITTPLPQPDNDEFDYSVISIPQLCEFFTHPTKYFLKHRMGITPAQSGTTVRDTEPFSIAGLEKYLLEQSLVNTLIKTKTLPEASPFTRVTGLLPHGTSGLCTYNQIKSDISLFINSIDIININTKNKTYRDVQISIGDFTISGRIEIITKDFLIQYRYAQIKLKDRLRIWINHLILNSINEIDIPKASLLIGKGNNNQSKCIEYIPIPNAKEILNNMLLIFIQGHTKPLPLYPETSFAFFKSTQSDHTIEKSLSLAKEKWNGSPFTIGESQDPFYRIHPSDSINFNIDFQNLAATVFAPMLKHEQKRDI